MVKVFSFIFIELILKLSIAIGISKLPPILLDGDFYSASREMRRFKRSVIRSVIRSVTVEGTGQAMTKEDVGECLMPGIEPALIRP